MMIMERPCRTLQEEMPFQNWPIHDAKRFEEFLREVDDFQSAKEKYGVDAWIIGSDVS